MMGAWLGAAQFLIGAGLGSWAVGKLDHCDVLYRFTPPMTKREKARLWALMLVGFAIAVTSPITVLFVG